MKRAIGLLVLIVAVTLFGAYVSSVRANGQQTPCEAGDNWKWEYCHNGHTICVGDANEAFNLTGHTEHGIDHEGNPPRGCSFIGCCSQGGSKDRPCKKDEPPCTGKGCTE